VLYCPSHLCSPHSAKQLVSFAMALRCASHKLDEFFYSPFLGSRGRVAVSCSVGSHIYSINQDSPACLFFNINKSSGPKHSAFPALVVAVSNTKKLEASSSPSSASNIVFHTVISTATSKDTGSCTLEPSGSAPSVPGKGQNRGSYFGCNLLAKN
jgi:hypothetical protein